MKIRMLSILIFLLAGCSDDFLEINPVSNVAIVELYKTESDFQGAIIGIYDRLRAIGGTFWVYDTSADDVIHQWGTAGTLMDIDAYVFRDNDERLSSDWNTYYQNIFRCNTILEKIEDATISNKEQYIAEARFMRAFIYFQLVKRWGDVPLVTIVLDDVQALKTPREDKNKVYEQIISDFNFAANNLPAQYSGDLVGKATSGAAKALLGRVYMFKGDFVNAESILQEVTTMGYALVDDYMRLWDYNLSEHHSEYIFDVEYVDEPGINSGFTNNFCPLDPAIIAFYQTTGSGNTYGPRDSFFEIWEEGDIRKEISAMRGVYDEDGNYIPITSAIGALTFQAKYMHPVYPSGRSPANWKIIRYADVLLMLAEAMNENGKTQQAHAPINEVRRRVNMPELSGLSQDELREKIYLERRFELSFEGLRWWDLIRTGKAYEMCAQYGMSQHNTLYPIPLEQIQVINDTEILWQNPGYN